MKKNKKIKVLFTIPNFNTAGSQYVLLAIYKKLDREIFEPYVLVEKDADYKPPEISSETFFCISKSKSKWRYIKSLYTFLKKHKIQILHSWDYKSSSLEAIACRLTNTKYVYTKKNNSWSKKWFLKSFLSNKIAYDNPLMFNRFFKNALLKNKTVFIPHGVDTTIFKPIISEKKINGFEIVSIGVLNSNKNQLLILNALRKLPNNYTVNFYGKEDKVYKKVLNAYIKKYQLQSKVNFYPYIDNVAIPEVLSTANLMILASNNEGLPLSIIEAMACGIPVLSSDSGGGAKYLLNKFTNELIFDVNNVDDLCKKIKNIASWSKEKFDKIVQSYIERVQHSFTIEKEVNLYENIYRNLN